ncbi:MAG: PAS domain S-box protein [Deltaproteobacteria bacterium]|nr:PAS domain S-box protein [Deltaproteobacteria bacterium]
MDREALLRTIGEEFEDPYGLHEILWIRTPVAVLLCRPDGEVLLASGGYARLFGASPPPGMNLRRDGVAGQGSEEATFAEAMRTGVAYLHASWYERLDAEGHPSAPAGRLAVEGYALRIDGGRGGRQHVLVTLRDVTDRLQDIVERQRIADELAARERHFRAIAEQGSDAVYLTGANGTIGWASPSVEHMLGYRPDELVGRHAAELGHPDDYPAMLGVLPTLLGQPGTPVTARYRIRHKEGRWIWVEARMVNLLHDPTVHALVASHRDVTAEHVAVEQLREQQRMLEEAQAVAHIGSLEIREDELPLVRWSHEAFRIFGFSEETPATYDRARSAIPKEDWKALGEAFAATWSDGRPIDLEHRVLRSDGTLRWVRLKTAIPEGGVPGRRRLTGTIQDITERKQLEAQLLQAQKMEAVGQLAGGVAHDFNNALSVILGFGGVMLAELPADSRLRADLDHVLAAGEHARDLVRQLLAFSRRQVLQPIVLDVNEAICEADRMLARTLGENVHVKLALAPSLALVKVDPAQLTQVVLNLAINARDAMPEGGLLTIETANAHLDAEYARQHPELTPGDYVLIAVTDTGIGIAPAVRDRIFEPFFTTKASGKGTGLGLSTVYGIVRQSGGHIWVYSELGQGTTFKIYLPVTDERARSAVASETPLEGRLGGTETVLVVEDEPGVREFVRRALMQHGYHVLEAPHAEAAMALMHEYHGPVDLLLTDVVLPGLSGRHLAVWLAERRPDLRVLYMSGYTEDTIVHRGVLNGGAPFLEKPFLSDTLARRVRQVLDAPARGA